MLQIIPFDKSQEAILYDKLRRDQMPYFEYKDISDISLKAYYLNSVNKYLSNGYLFSAIENEQLIGFISCTMDTFDSDNFGFNCFRINNLNIFTDSFDKAVLTIKELINKLEAELTKISKPFHLSIGVNNNIQNIDHVFNSLVSAGFYYLHSLLTFSTEKKLLKKQITNPIPNIEVRVASIEDAEQVAELAQRSFRFSRFHLDPFLDNELAGGLLKKSAMNSIIHGFVDIMFVAVHNEKVVGYYSAKKRYIPEFDKTIGEAVISAVHSEYRGQNIFSSLDSNLLNWFDDNSDIAEMGTYLVNYPVHKTWINKGLKLIRGVHQFSKFIE